MPADGADRSAHTPTPRKKPVIPSNFQILRTQSRVPLYLSFIWWVLLVEDLVRSNIWSYNETVELLLLVALITCDVVLKAKVGISEDEVLTAAERDFSAGDKWVVLFILFILKVDGFVEDVLCVVLVE